MKRVSRWLSRYMICLAMSMSVITFAQDDAPKPEEEVTVVEDVEDTQQEPEEQEEAVVEDEAAQEDESEIAEPDVQEDDVQDEPEEATESEDEDTDSENQDTQEADESDQESTEQEEPDQEPEPEEEQPEPEPQPELGPDEVMGIDTVDLEDPQGNWLYKRVWWERAESKYEKIRSTVNKILEQRTGFFARRAELDKNVLDPFYIKIGLSQGELQEIINDLIQMADKRTKDQKEDHLLEKAQEDKKVLEKVKEDVEKIIKQDDEVEQAILVLVEQINKIRQVEQQAWQDFKNIARVLDDRKARELFYRVDNGWRNIQELGQYLEGNFTASFDKLIEKIKQEIEQVDSAVARLKERGIDLKNKLLEPSADEPEDDEQEPEPKGFVARYITDPLKQLVGSIWSVIRWPYDKIMGQSQPVDQDEPDDDESDDEQEAEQDQPQEESQKNAQEPATQEPVSTLVQEQVEMATQAVAPETAESVEGQTDLDESEAQEEAELDDDEQGSEPLSDELVTEIEVEEE